MWAVSREGDAVVRETEVKRRFGCLGSWRRGGVDGFAGRRGGEVRRRVLKIKTARIYLL